MTTTLARPHAHLKSTGRGKHIHPFSYYHVALVETSSRARDQLSAIRLRLRLDSQPFNVVKLDAGHRISFLLYQDFDVAFPALLAACSCNLQRREVRPTNYEGRSNPPILHRKELLLPANHPLVPEATKITERLEYHGAFKPTTTIGTRLGWQRRLTELCIDATGNPIA